MNSDTEFIESKLPLSGLVEIENEAKERHIPILRGDSAVFLRQLVGILQPKSVLEIGTGIGYSGSIIMSASNAKLITTEHNLNSLERAKFYFNMYGFSERVTTILGDESEIIPLLTKKQDLIFLDGAKTRYVHHLPYLKRLLNKKGVLLADNVLFGGRVSGQNTQIGTKLSIVEGLRAFLNEICSDNDFLTSILNIGDGMSLSILKE